MVKSANYEREAWQGLLKLAQQQRVRDFWAAYAQYLKDNNVVSAARQVLYSMARLTVLDYERSWRELADARRELADVKALLAQCGVRATESPDKEQEASAQS